MAANRLGVVIVDDHALYRGGIRAALEHEPELLVLGETAGGEAAIEKIRGKRLDGEKGDDLPNRLGDARGLVVSRDDDGQRRRGLVRGSHGKRSP